MWTRSQRRRLGKLNIALSLYGQTFATRERARELLETIDQSALADEEPCVDLTGVVASPSFMAEFLNQLAVRHVSIAVTGGSDYLQNLTENLVERLGLSGRVRMIHGAAL